MSCYGAFVDADGFMWIASLGGQLAKFDTGTVSGNEPVLVSVFNGPSNYGITGFQAPDDDRTIVILGNGGDVFAFDSGINLFRNDVSYGRFVSETGAVIQPGCYAPSFDGNGDLCIGTLSNNFAKYRFSLANDRWERIVFNPSTQRTDRASIADTDGDVWLMSLGSSTMQKVNGTTGAVITTVSTGNSPYTYSDATGLGLRTNFPIGTYTTAYDSGCSITTWGTITWDADIPTGTEVTLEARSSNDLVNFSAFEPATNGGMLTATPAGRCIQVRATLRVNAGLETPCLNSLTIMGTTPRLAIDIYPGRSVNPIDLTRNYSIPVVVIGSAEIDVADLDPTTARFGATGTEATTPRSVIRDLTGDGIPDMLLYFSTFASGFAAGNTQGVLTIGLTGGGCSLSASDSIVVRGSVMPVTLSNELAPATKGERK